MTRPLWPSPLAATEHPVPSTLSGSETTAVDPSTGRPNPRHLESGRIIILAGRTGNTFFTTDTCAALRASELAAEVLDSIEGVFLDKVKSSPPPGTLGVETDDLVRLMRGQLVEEGFRQAALEQLEQLRMALPPEVMDDLDEDSLDALLDEAIAEVALSLQMAALR